MSPTPPATIYSLTACGWSRKAREYFEQRGIKALVIEYDTVGPDLQQRIGEEMRKGGSRRLPLRACRRQSGQKLRPGGLRQAAQGRLTDRSWRRGPEERAKWLSRSR